MTVQPLGSLGIILSQWRTVVSSSPFDAHFSERAPSTMSALRRSLRAGFAAAKRVTAANAVGAAGPARAILAGSLRTQVRSDCFSETQSCSRRSRSAGTRGSLDRRDRADGRGVFDRGTVSEVRFYRAVSRCRDPRPFDPSRPVSPPPCVRWGRGRRRPRLASSACTAPVSHRFFPALIRAQTQKHRPCPP